MHARYQFINNGYMFAEFCNGDVQGYDADGNTAVYYLNLFTAPFYQGKTNTVSVGFALGF
jgi:hypothetical protein